MICPSCGNEVPEGSTHCTFCGSSLAPKQAGAPDSGGQAPLELAAQEKAVRKKAARKVIVLVIAVLAVIGIVAFEVASHVVESSAGHGEQGGEPSQAVSAEAVSEDESSSEEVDSGSSGNLARKFIGTWVCDTYDLNGALYTYQVAFDEGGYWTQWLYQTNSLGDAWYDKYKLSENKLELSNGNWFEYEAKDGEDCLVLHIGLDGKDSHSNASNGEYVFEKTKTMGESSPYLIRACDTWYRSSDGKSIKFDPDGYWYWNGEANSENMWYVSENVVCAEEGSETHRLQFDDNMKTLTYLDGQYKPTSVTYTLTEPTTTSTSSSSAQSA